MRPTHGPTTLLLASAFLATASELPAQTTETPSALESAPAGWKDLLADAGPGLKGWTRLPVPPGSTPKTTRTGSQFRLDPETGYLVCEGDGGHEWLRWDEEVGDAVFHVEWRFTPVAGKRGFNSGVFVRNSADAKLWFQAQTGDASGGFLFGDMPVDGKPTRVNLSRQLKDKRVKPAGEWNTYEITCKGKEVSLWVNGAVTSVFDACEVTKGYVGLEAEGFRIEFRNVKLKPLQ
jgi:hypothetical protein